MLRYLLLCIVLTSNIIVLAQQFRNIDAEMMADAIAADREKESTRLKKIKRRGATGQALENLVSDADFAKSKIAHLDDDYSDFEKNVLSRDVTQELKTVSFSESGAEDMRPKLDPSEIAVGNRGEKLNQDAFPVPGGLQDGIATPKATKQMITKKGPEVKKTLIVTKEKLPLYKQLPPRQGFYFQHYPWWLLPRQYRLRSKDFGYIYPPQYQNTHYYWPGRLSRNYDPFAIYYQTQKAREAYANMYSNSYGNYGNYGGYGGTTRISSYEEDEDEEAQSGEVELSKKKDPLDDLSLETLEKIDKLGEDGIVEVGDKDEFRRKVKRAPFARALRMRH